MNRKHWLCIAAISAASVMSLPARANVSGSWQTRYGDMSLSQRGASVTGTYNFRQGTVDGTLRGNVLTGYWSESHSAKKCRTSRNGSFYWGRIAFEFKDLRSRFVGRWGYCDGRASRPWRGTVKGITRIRRALKTHFGVSTAGWSTLWTKYLRRDANNKDDLFTFAVDAVLNDPDVRIHLSHDSKRRLRNLIPPKPVWTGPVMVPMTKKHRKHDCSRSAIISRLMQRYPAFRAQLLKAKLNVGTKGSAFILSRLEAAVKVAQRACKQGKAF